MPFELTPSLCDDRYFRVFMEDDLWQQQRQELARRFTLYEPYADKHFLRECKRDFLARYWELMVCTELLDHGFPIDHVKPGPDNCMLHNGKRIWIEATVAHQGTDPSTRVPEMQFSGPAQTVPNRQIKLRYTQRLAEKQAKCAEYAEAGIVAAADPVVIALHAGNLPFANHEKELPRIVECVFAIGPQYITLEPGTGELVDAGYQTQWNLSKDNGADVPHNLFLKEEYRGISAILFSTLMPHEIGCKPVFEVLVHNHRARVPLEHGLIPVAREFSAEGTLLRCVERKAGE